MRFIYRYMAFATTALTLTACQTPPASPPPPPINASIIDAYLTDLVASDTVRGVGALVYRDSEEIYYGEAGMADAEAGRAWERDTLVTIYSMTKPITGVTLMSLYEDGLFALDDPLSDYLPEFANMRVATEVGEDGEIITEPANRPLQVIDIMRHTACMGYGNEDYPAAQPMAEANVLDPSKPLSQFSEELAALPLYCQPGTQWKYGVAVDVQARLAEVLAGKPYGELVRDRVLGPLGMDETRYFVEPEDKPRLAAIYVKGEDGTLSQAPDASVYSFSDSPPVQTNGGHGLISTIDDYMRFARMLQNEGELDGVRILEPETIALMSRDHLPDDLTAKDFLPSKGQVGFGLDFAVRTAPPVDSEEPYGFVGEFFWDGAPSPFFWVDPANDVTAVFMIQVFPFNAEAQKGFRRAVYEAMDLYEIPLSVE